MIIKIISVRRKKGNLATQRIFALKADKTLYFQVQYGTN